MLTPFGIAIRKLRLEKSMRLLDLARHLGISSAQVSAVETGKRTIQPEYVAQVIRVMDLNDDQAEELRRAADKTRAEVRVEHLPMNQRELVSAFARKIDALPAELIEQLKKQVLKAVDAEQPFRRRRKGAVVPGQSTAGLRNFAEQVRSLFVPAERSDFPIMDVLEFRLTALAPSFELIVCSHKEMGEDEGRVIPGCDAIFLREDVYEGAWSGIGRDRFTACHEFAHYLLHRNVGFPRTRADDEPIYCDAEWQADAFAGALMMSARHAASFSGVVDAAAHCGMTQQAATVMLQKYGVRNV